MANPDTQLVTSNYILVETCALVRNRLGMPAVEVLLRDILPAITVIWIEEALHFAAMEAMLTAGARGPSLVDCASFAFMDSAGITQAFSYNQHFALQGFCCLLHVK